MRMKRSIALFAGLFLLLSLAVMASAQDKKKNFKKQDRLSGTVHMVDKDASTIIIRKGIVQRTVVVYNAETQFTIQNKPGGSIDDVIVGRQVTCVGSFNDQAQLLATRVEIRSK